MAKSSLVKEDRKKDRLDVPSVSEKIKALRKGEKIGGMLKPSIAILEEVLETIKGIILVMVSGLDETILSEEDAKKTSLKAFSRSRGVKLYDEDSMVIWLERGGKWFVRFYGEPHSKLRAMDSRLLAKAILEKSDSFLRKFRFAFGAEETLLNELALYQVICIELPLCFIKNISEIKKRREEKYRLMEERIHLLKDFVDSLDPLLNKGEELKLRECSIFHTHSDRPGYSKNTSDYFHPEALKPFWEIYKHCPDRERYHLYESNFTAKSLHDVLWRMSRIFEGISRAEGKGAKEIWGIDRRLPLTTEEREVLRDFVSSIFAK